VACAGFILSGAEIHLRGGRKKMRGGRLAKKISAPPAEFDSAPPGRIHFCPPCRIRFCPRGRTDKRGAENLIIPRERGRNI